MQRKSTPNRIEEKRATLVPRTVTLPHLANTNSGSTQKDSFGHPNNSDMTHGFAGRPQRPLLSCVRSSFRPWICRGMGAEAEVMMLPGFRSRCTTPQCLWQRWKAVLCGSIVVKMSLASDHDALRHNACDKDGKQSCVVQLRLKCRWLQITMRYATMPATKMESDAQLLEPVWFSGGEDLAWLHGALHYATLPVAKMGSIAEQVASNWKFNIGWGLEPVWL